MALRSKIRTNLQVTRVFRLKCSCSLSDPHGHDGVSTRHPLFGGPRRLHPFSYDRHLSDSVFHQSVILVAVPVLCYRSFISVRHLRKDGLSPLSFLTVTLFDRLHDGDGSNGVKGAAKEGKL